MVDITDWNDLDAVRNDLTASYTLQNDLDSSTAGYTGIGDDWTPLGFLSDQSQGDPFTGSLNGQGFQISDLVIENDTASTGGLGVISKIGTDGLVENLEVDGTVDSTITDFYYGGLVGYNNGTMQNCASHMDVTAPNGGYVGSLCGRQQEMATDCYATGSVDGDEDVGGLVGDNRGTVTNCYSVGSVTGNTAVGGLTGSGSATDSYWDTETSGQSTSAGGTGLTTSEMQGDEASTNMSTFDFSDTWYETIANSSPSINGKVPDADGYPILQALDAATQLAAQGINFREPLNGIYIDGTEYDCLVDGTQYEVVQN